MVFKRLMYGMLTILFLFQLSCQQNKNSQKAELTNKGNKLSVIMDSIVFRTSNEEFTYLAERIYPKATQLDSLTIAQLIQSDILSIERVGDTLFVFINNEKLFDRQNDYLPSINDSLISSFYPKYYNVVIDDDIPYFVYLKNSKDDITLIKDKQNEIFSWTSAIIRDTVLSFSGIKPGQEKDEVFAHLGLPEFEFNKDDFSLILCHASIPSEIWFKSILKSHEIMNSFGYEEYKLETDKPNIQILFSFKDSILEYMFLSPWIGYGNKSQNLI